MKKVMKFTCLESCSSTYGEYQWNDYDEIEGAGEWYDGDIVEYLNDQDWFNCQPEHYQLHIEEWGSYCGKSHNQMNNCIFLVNDEGTPCQMYWVEEVDDDEEDNEDY